MIRARYEVATDLGNASDDPFGLVLAQGPPAEVGERIDARNACVLQAVLRELRYDTKGRVNSTPDPNCVNEVRAQLYPECGPRLLLTEINTELRTLENSRVSAAACGLNHQREAGYLTPGRGPVIRASRFLIGAQRRHGFADVAACGPVERVHAGVQGTVPSTVDPPA